MSIDKEEKLVVSQIKWTSTKIGFKYFKESSIIGNNNLSDFINIDPIKPNSFHRS
jgi:hypothetical protein